MGDSINNNHKGRVRQKNEARILAAAENEFLKFGFEGASIKRIAETAGLPRANIHYYFGSKSELYASLLRDIVNHWDQSIDTINADDDPAETLRAYIHAKVMAAKNNPAASRIFASEMIHGAPHLSQYLKTDFRISIEAKTSAIQAWIDQGKMDPVDPYHLLFMIWGATQHYADFGVQVLAALNKPILSDADFEDIANNITTIILKGCGIS